jgi:hypothetical protein
MLSEASLSVRCHKNKTSSQGSQNADELENLTLRDSLKLSVTQNEGEKEKKSSQREEKGKKLKPDQRLSFARSLARSFDNLKKL